MIWKLPVGPDGRHLLSLCSSADIWYLRRFLAFSGLSASQFFIVPCLALNRTADFSIRNWNRINIICACWPSLKTACLNWEGIVFHVCYLLNSEHDDWNWIYLIATWYESWISFLFCSNTDNLFIKLCNLMYGQSINNMLNEYWMDDSTFANFLDEYSELGPAANYKAVSQVWTFIEYLEVLLIHRCGWHWYVSNNNIILKKMTNLVEKSDYAFSVPLISCFKIGQQEQTNFSYALFGLTPGIVFD